jgi:hypothetical protein
MDMTASKPTLIFALCSAVLFLQSCGKPTYQHFEEVANGHYKVMIRDQEFANSSIHNVDICVTNASEHSLPEKSSGGCFLYGYDFNDGPEVRWLGPLEIEVFFRSGRVINFTNEGWVDDAKFHIRLCDGCAAPTEELVPLHAHPSKG